MFRQFSWQEEANRGLNFARSKRLSVAIAGQLCGLGGDAFEEVLNEGVHDTHCLG